MTKKIGFDRTLLDAMAAEDNGKTLNQAIAYASSYLILKMNFDIVMRHGFMMEDGVMRAREGREVDDLVNKIIRGELA